MGDSGVDIGTANERASRGLILRRHTAGPSAVPPEGAKLDDLCDGRTLSSGKWVYRKGECRASEAGPSPCRPKTEVELTNPQDASRVPQASLTFKTRLAAASPLQRCLPAADKAICRAGSSTSRPWRLWPSRAGLAVGQLRHSVRPIRARLFATAEGGSARRYPWDSGRS